VGAFTKSRVKLKGPGASGSLPVFRFGDKTLVSLPLIAGLAKRMMQFDNGAKEVRISKPLDV
jgi:hypothetical protein